MSAFTEKNFNAALDAISEMRDQRDEALRVAHGFEDTLGRENHCYDPRNDCPCTICALGKKLSDLRLKVASFHARVQSARQV